MMKMMMIMTMTMMMLTMMTMMMMMKAAYNAGPGVTTVRRRLVASEFSSATCAMAFGL